MLTYKDKLNFISYYLFIFLFLTVSLIPFNILNIKIGNVLFHYIYIGAFVSVLAVLSYIQQSRLTVFDKWLFFLIFGFSLSLINSIDRTHTIRVLIGFIMKGIGVAFLSYRILKDKTKITITIMVICSTAIALLGLLEFFRGWHIYPKPQEVLFYIITSTIGNPLPFAIYLILFFPLLLLYSSRRKSIVSKFLLIFIVTLAILLSFSRSGWISLFFVIFIFFTRKGIFILIFKKWIYPAVFIFVIILIFSFLPPWLGMSHFKSKFNIKMFSSASFGHRLKSYNTTLNILKDYPLFGVGFGNYPKVHGKYIVEGVGRDTPTPDNMYLRFLCDTGIVGAGIFFVFIIYWMHKLWKSRDNPVVWAIFCGLVGFLINQLTADLFLWTAPQFAFWMLLGFGVGIINNGTGNQNG